MQSVPTVATAVLTHDRPKELRLLLESLRRQSVNNKVIVVDSGDNPSEELVKKFDDVLYVPSKANLGGAGGFSLAILLCISSGADWVWILDDDGCPQGIDCLKHLLEGANRHDLRVVSPVITAPDDCGRLSFPFKIEGSYTCDRKVVEAAGFLPNIAQFFNGAVVHKSVFYELGLPKMELFIRGDEVDFLLRLRKNAVKFGTITTVAVSHPPGWGEVVSMIRGKIFILVPETPFKRYYFYRNRGYLARKHRRIVSFSADVLLYPIFFLFILKEGNLAAFRFWITAYWHGLSYNMKKSLKN
jgi:rhamnopyranosyl-N-acetylglucosaminyl-diphospho-decaprenol beta-1,3/1,4-galactofuranosyltransferase